MGIRYVSSVEVVKIHKVRREVKQRGLAGEKVSKVVQSFPIFLRDAVSRFAIVNDGSFEGTIDEGVRIG